MNIIKQFKWQAFVLLPTLLLLACTGSGEPTAKSAAETAEVPVQVPTDPAAKEDVLPTAEPSATAVTKQPTIEPSQTPQPSPTSNTTPVSETEPAPESTATPLPDGWLGPENFGSDINPLTGETVEDLTLLQRRPIAIKISNFPKLVRPQAGLNNADLVFEHYAEGGATRFTAVFYSQDAHTVGSVRSARIIDFEIPVMYDAALGYSGAAGGNKDRFSGVDWFDRIISPDFGHGGYYRAQSEDPEEDFWHTMFTDTYRLRAILQERNLDNPPQLQNGMIFSQEPPEDGSPAEQIEIRYSGNYVTWWYDSGLGRYMRWTDGERHNDANRDEQINFKNIVVVWAEHVDTWITETEVAQGAQSIEIQIWGEGPVTIFRDGQRYDGLWHRDDPKDMLTFTDMEGNPIPLSSGNTWFQLVPSGFDKLYVTS